MKNFLLCKHSACARNTLNGWAREKVYMQGKCRSCAVFWLDAAHSVVQSEININLEHSLIRNTKRAINNVCVEFQLQRSADEFNKFARFWLLSIMTENHFIRPEPKTLFERALMVHLQAIFFESIFISGLLQSAMKHCGVRAHMHIHCTCKLPLDARFSLLSIKHVVVAALNRQTGVMNGKMCINSGHIVQAFQGHYQLCNCENFTVYYVMIWGDFVGCVQSW